MAKILTEDCNFKCENFLHEYDYGNGKSFCIWGKSKKKKVLKPGTKEVKCRLKNR